MRSGYDRTRWPGRDRHYPRLVEYLAFVVVAAVLVAIPGPSVVLVSIAAGRNGVRVAAATSLGVFVADLIWMAASVAGITAVLVASAPVFTAIRYVGAAYLVYLGVKLLTSAKAAPDSESTRPPSPPSLGAALRRGLICDLSNPKTLLVFTSVIPQFLHRGSAPAEAVLLGATFAVLGLASLTVWIALVVAGRQRVRGGRLGTLLTRASGALLVAFGFGLAIER